MRWALVIGCSVANVVEQGSQPAGWVQCPDWVGPGDILDGETFTRPAPVEIRHITQLAFISRFTDPEAIALDLASIGATEGAAALRRYLNKVNVARFIDLERADTRAGVQALETAGLLAAGRALEILDAEIAAGERP